MKPKLKNATPIQALRRVERMLRRHGDIYHIVIEMPNLGLGEWLRHVIKRHRKQREV